MQHGRQRHRRGGRERACDFDCVPLTVVANVGVVKVADAILAVARHGARLLGATMGQLVLAGAGVGARSEEWLSSDLCDRANPEGV